MAHEKNAKYQLRLPQDLLDKALENARTEDLSLAQVLRRLLREWIEDPPKSDGGDRLRSLQEIDPLSL